MLNRVSPAQWPHLSSVLLFFGVTYVTAVTAGQEESSKKRERETRALQERLARVESSNTKLQMEKEVLEVSENP